MAKLQQYTTRLIQQGHLEEFTETVLFYIKCCTDNVTIKKILQRLPSQKPWMTIEIKRLLKDQTMTFTSGDKGQHSVAELHEREALRN